jgi:hypothetical protein
MYFVTYLTAMIMSYFGVRGYPSLLVLAVAFFLVNMGIIALAIVNLYRLPFFHSPGQAPPHERARVFLLRMWAIILAGPFFLSMGGLFIIVLGVDWLAIPVYAVLVLTIIVIVVTVRSPVESIEDRPGVTDHGHGDG